MAFDSDYFGVNGDVSQRGNGPTVFTYSSAVDTKEGMLAAGYFAGARDYLDVGSLINISCPEGVWTGVVTTLSPVTAEDKLNTSFGSNLVYGGWGQEIPIILSNATQYFDPETERAAKNVTYDGDGVFTLYKTAAYEVTVERVYTNSDAKPSTPLTVSVVFMVNDEELFSRTATMAKAQSAAFPSYASFTTPFIFEGTEGDKLKLGFYTDSINTGTNLKVISINGKISRVN